MTLATTAFSKAIAAVVVADDDKSSSHVRRAPESMREGVIRNGFGEASPQAVYITGIDNDELGLAKEFVKRGTFTPRLDSTPRVEAERFKAEICLPHGVDVVLECTGVQISAQTGICCV
ncbi:D-xylulose reductase [Geosmithia morbida]|uniref:D-xylulose reductase n=1 Tax=Geosmithia morbida TaxID=1094350 RepID=A0A9P4YUN1_9HYPO|nr:D-xylulose reductase [Geosmithia morbida]KAF4122008.1 D-xylulose reductase [Geosmithia morbida]